MRLFSLGRFRGLLVFFAALGGAASSSVAPAQTLSGVISGNGAPVSNAVVNLSRATMGGQTHVGSTHSTPNGFYTFSVEAGVYNLRVLPPQGTNLLEASVNGVEVNADVTRNVELPQRAVLSGTVYAQDGTTSASGITVFAGSYFATTGPGGRYEMALPPGTYNLGLKKPGAVQSNVPCPTEFVLRNVVENLTVSGHTVQNFSLPAFPRITGLVKNGDQAPVAGVVVTASTGSTTTPVQVFSRAETNPNGFYALRVLPGSYWMKAQPPPFSPYFPAHAAVQVGDADLVQDFVLSGADTHPPVIVSGPLVRFVSAHEAVIEWQTNEPATGIVKFGTTNPPGGTAGHEQLSTFHSVRLVNLAAQTTYYYKVMSRDGAGNGPTSSAVLSFVTHPEETDTRPPVIVYGPHVGGITEHSAVVEWGTNEPATTVVRFGTSPEINQTTSVAGLVMNHRLVLRGLNPGTQYYLRVSSTDASNNGPTLAPWQPIPFRTLGGPDTWPPAIIGGPVAVDITSNAATLKWMTNEPSTSAATYFDGVTTASVEDDALVLHHVLRLSDLAPQTTYTVRVASTDGQGNGPTYSRLFPFVTRPAADTRPPRILEGPFAVDVTNAAASIVWNTDEHSDSVVQFGTTSGSLTRHVSRADLVRRHVVRIADLESSTTYYYRVGSKDPAGNGPTWSPVRRFHTRGTADIYPPRILDGPRVIHRTDRTATLYWRTDEHSNTVVDYGSSGTLAHRYSNPDLVLEHRATLTDLEAGLRYQFRISSTDASGNTVYAGAGMGSGPTADWKADGETEFTTNQAADTAAPVVIGGPTVAAITHDSALVTWTTDEVADSRVSYNLQGQPLNLSAGEVTLTSEHAVVLTGLSAGTVYSLQVASGDAVGNVSAAGAPVTFTTSAAPDTSAPGFVPAPSVGAVTANSAVVTWGTTELATGQVSLAVGVGGAAQTVADDGYASAHSITLTNLQPGTTYSAKAGATDLAGNETESAPVSFTTATNAAVADWTLY